MYRNSNSAQGESPISVIGAGIAGAWQALLFAKAGRAVTLHERSGPAMTQSTSYWAGGMLAPYCEAEGCEPVIVRLGIRSLALWREHFPQTPFNGSLVVAHARDRGDYERFARLTCGYRRLDAQGIGEIEPSLEGRFREGLFYAGEGHVEPRHVLPQLHARITAAGGRIEFNSEAEPDDIGGVVIHPRWPLYIIPRGHNRFMLGATSIESDDNGVSVRSALELLGAAYSVHPAFAEARIVEFGSGLRPAYPDNLPRIAVNNDKIAVNGLYRHGFLLAPALAELTVGYVARGVIDNEVMQCA
jgi:glycine oxidase